MAIPSPRFIVNSAQGTVTDQLTGLVWLYQVTCDKVAGAYTAIEARAAALADGQCGLDDGSVAGDWRLPTVSELVSLIDYRVFPHISDVTGTVPYNQAGATAPFDPDTFLATSYYSGSPTLVPSASTKRYTVNLSTGAVTDSLPTTTAYLIAVRGSSGNAPVAVSHVSGSSTVAPGGLVTLSGVNSYLPGANSLTPDPTYHWTLTPPAGSSAALSSDNIATPTVTTDVSGRYLASLVVNFGTWDSTAAQVAFNANVAPVAQNAAIATNEDTLYNGTLTAANSDAGAFTPAQTLTYSIVGQGTKGTALILNATTGSFRYTPNAGANGSDSFTFRATDGLNFSNTATVTVTINPVSDAPVNTVLPAVTGTAQVGQVLTASNGTWTNPSAPAGTVTYAYQWQRDTDGVTGDEANIASATASTYTLGAADSGQYVRVRVTATANGESNAAFSALAGPVAP